MCCACCSTRSTEEGEGRERQSEVRLVLLHIKCSAQEDEGAQGYSDLRLMP